MITLLGGDCREVLRTLPAASIDAVVTDPPYDLLSVSRGGSGRSNEPDTTPGRHGSKGGGFMGMAWDATGVAFLVSTWQEILRVCKPGAHLLAFGGTRTQHRMVAAIEDAGFEIRDSIVWIYGCLSADTEIRTAEGWEQYHTLTPGRIVLGYNVESQTFDWMPVEEVYVYPYSDTAYHLHSDHTDQIVSRNHRCLVERVGKYVFEVAEALQRQARVPILEDVSGVLDALPVPQSDASDTIHDLRRVVPWTAVRGARADLVRVDPIVYTGIVWCVRVRSGAFVARRNGKAFVTGNTGFAKSKGLPDGLGNALKPAHEDICVARVPLIGTLESNIAAHGTGALRIEDNLIGTSKRVPASTSTRQGYNYGNQQNKQTLDTPGMDATTGRWPANVLLSHAPDCLPTSCSPDCPISELDRQSGNQQRSQTPAIRRTSHFGKNSREQEVDTRTIYDGGGASRFFYVAKASTRDRTANHSITNSHPTVKPVSLLRHLVRLICPPNGIVLDPFMGSGSTGVAALEENCSFTGIEQDPAYLTVASARISSVPLPLFPVR